MEITKAEVEHIAELARLELTGDEKALYAGQLGSILGWASELSKADTAGVRPTAHVLGLENVTRADEPRPFAGREELLKLAPEREYDFVKVPKVID